MAIDDGTGRSIKEQYYIVYNDSQFDAYSFFNEGWIKDVYGEDNAAAKFPLLRDTENPITHNASGSYKLLTIIPFASKKHESGLALVYDKGILMVDLTGIHNNTTDTQWIKLDGEKILSPNKLFSNSSVSIVDCKLDDFNGSNFLVITSTGSQIASFDLDTETIYNPNVNYLDGVPYEDQENVLNSLPIMFKPDDRVIGDIENSRSKNALSVTDSKALVIKDDESQYLEPRVGLSLLIGYIEPSSYSGDPWVLLEKFYGTGMPQTVSDAMYEKMMDEDKEKYKIHPRLTVQYAWNTQNIKNYTPETTIDHEYIDLYTDTLTPQTEGVFKIYRGGQEISKSIYFGYSDEMRAECNVYKIATINYTFVRMSFNNDGTGISDGELNERITAKKPVYAFYYKTGVKVDEHYGYKIKFTERIVNGSDTIYSDEFGNYVTNAKTQTGSFDDTKYIPGWKIVSRFTDYSKNVVDNLNILENIKYVYPINGYIDVSTGKYAHQYIISDGYKSQLIKVVRGTINILCEYDFGDNNELVGVKTIEDDIKVYLIFKDQRIVVLGTYEYVPTELFMSRMNEVDFFVITDDPKKETSISYVTSDKRIVNISLSTSSSKSDNPTHFTKAQQNMDNDLITLINCTIQQTEPFKYVSNAKRWHVLPGNDRSKLMESQIN
jgi:hypothetical protein